MALYGEITREVRRGPKGPKVGAFFDLDRTLLAGFSALVFFQDRLLSGRMGPRDLAESVASAASFRLGRTGFSGLMAATARMFRGLSERALVEFGERIFVEQLAKEIYPEARALVRAHREAGHTLAIVSSATPYQIEPVARDLGIAHVLCTQLEVRDGAFTGRVLPPVCYGIGKRVAAEAFAERVGVDLAESYFYTDSHEDLPLLEAVGRPRPLNPNRRLAAIAAERGWPVRRFRSRGLPGPSEVLRTALALGSLGTAFSTAVPPALLNASRRLAVNLTSATWGELGTALAGIEVHVEGEHHLWSHRPAVFIFNHQSGIDALLLCKLLRRDFVGIAKKELRSNPIFGPAFRFAGAVFLDRAHRERAIEGLRPAVEALERGLSIVIAPEGTRSPTPRPGPFKKGAFHIAMQARVPIVPIVFLNTLDALPKHARVVRPASVEVVVHPPISSQGWTRQGLDREIEKIHRLYLETLDR